jgi:putative ABC transport system substrate-binding protein
VRRREFIALIGSTATWPLTARAQQRERMRRIAVLMSTSEDEPEERESLEAHLKMLEALGWVVGRNIVVDYRWGAGDPRRMEIYARELVELAPDVILSKGGAVPAAAQATTTIPIVFVVLSDALVEPFAGALARPIRNLTGFTSSESSLIGKRLELLKELSAATHRILYIRGDRPATQALLARGVEDASRLGMVLTDLAAHNDADITQGIASFAKIQNGAICAAFDAFNIVHRRAIVEAAAHHRIPAIYVSRLFVEAGGLISYGFDQPDQFRQAATYVDRILRGEKPGDLPVQRATKFELVINLKTAKILGLTIPPILLARADEVIE